MRQARPVPPTLLIAFGLILGWGGPGTAGAHAQQHAHTGPDLSAPTHNDAPTPITLTGYAAGLGVHFRDGSGMDAAVGAGFELRAGISAAWDLMAGVELLGEATGDYRIGFLDLGVVRRSDAGSDRGGQRYVGGGYTRWFGDPPHRRNPGYDGTRSGGGLWLGAGYRHPLGPTLDLDAGLRLGGGLLRLPPPSMGLATEQSEWSWALRPRVGLTWSR